MEVKRRLLPHWLQLQESSFSDPQPKKRGLSHHFLADAVGHESPEQLVSAQYGGLPLDLHLLFQGIFGLNGLLHPDGDVFFVLQLLPQSEA